MVSLQNDAVLLAKRLIVDSIWKSANLEGLGTTFPKTEAILDNLSVDDTSRDEILFIINMKRAWEFLLENLEYNNCLMLFRQYNKIVLDNLSFEKGCIRKLPVAIGGTSWTPSVPIEADIYKNIENIEKINSPIDKALKYFCFIARTQMFLDGNKRVAQLMANKVLIEANIGIFQIPVEALAVFKSMLLRFYESNDDAEIILFMKKYCIRKLTGFDILFETEKVSVSKFEEQNIEDNFVLSDKQIKIFNSILINIRKLLLQSGISGTVVLYDNDGIVQLICSKGTVSLKSLYNPLDISFSTDLDMKLLRNFIIKTVELLVNHIPFAIKKVSFSVSNENLCFGKLYNSEEEEGSLVVELW